MSSSFMIRPPPSDQFDVLRKVSMRQLAAAVAKATDDTVKAGRDDIRTKMSATRLGKLSRAVAATSDLQKKRVPDINTTGSRWRAGGVIYSRGNSERTEGALAAYSNGNVSIVPKRGRWLAIATDELAKRVPGIKGSGKRGGGKYRMTPRLYNERGLDRKIGKLVFVSNGGANEALLIVNNVQVSAARGFGNARRIPKTGNIKAGKVKKDFIVAFVLIRVTRRAERVNPRDILAAQVKRMTGRIADNLRGKVAGTAGGKTIASWGASFTR